MKGDKKITLTEKELPTHWYNIVADMTNKPLPPLNPVTKQAASKEDFLPIFAEELVNQEFSQERFIEIPEQVQDLYKIWRPTPLVRAYGLEKALDTPARIYYKFEGNNTSGSHKLNSAVAQAYYAKMQGLTGVTTETGAGQWGTALSEACSYFGLTCDVFMVKCSYEQKPFRKAVMNVFDASITPSPSPTTEVGRQILRDHPETTGSLGCAISEAVESAVQSGGAKRYVLGSVLNQVLLHQSIIGLESKLAMEQLGEYPDVVVGCAGGGSNLGGLIAPFMADKLRGIRNPRIVAVEPASCPSLTRGKYAYDFCDTGMVCPLAKMYTLGSNFIPSPSHAGGLRYHGMSSILSQLYHENKRGIKAGDLVKDAGGLRYHGMSPILSKLYHDGYMEAVAYEQTRVFEAAVLFAKRETILPAPESAHAIRGAIDEALRCRESREAKTILFGLTGTGYFDMTAYENYLNGKMSDSIPTDADLQKGFDSLPKIPQNEGI